MLIVTGLGLIFSFISIALRPFARRHEAGRRLAKMATVVGVGSPLMFVMLLGSELAEAGRLVLMSPIAVGLVALAIYPNQPLDVRGFEVLPPQHHEPEGGDDKQT